MLHKDCERLDPRIRRTRNLLQDALRRLLEEKEFDKISVQDITEAATLNRATFYAHYSDKFALLEEFIRVSFLDILEEKNVQFDGTCPSALQVIILTVCEYLIEAEKSLSSKQHQYEPFLQSKVIDQIREVLLDGFRQHPRERRVAPETIAATVSWAIYGAVKQWVDSADRLPQEEFVQLAVDLIHPIMMAGIASGAEVVSEGRV
jgi:AcrR family transcriptional regulator